MKSLRCNVDYLTPYFWNFVTQALYNMCTLQYGHSATCALCSTCIMQQAHFAHHNVNYAIICNIIRASKTNPLDGSAKWVC